MLCPSQPPPPLPRRWRSSFSSSSAPSSLRLSPRRPADISDGNSQMPSWKKTSARTFTTQGSLSQGGCGSERSSDVLLERGRPIIALHDDDKDGRVSVIAVQSGNNHGLAVSPLFSTPAAREEKKKKR